MKFERARQHLLDYVEANSDEHFQGLQKSIIREVEARHIYLYQERAEPFLERLVELIAIHPRQQHLQGLKEVATSLLSLEEKKQYQRA